jgi:uncharacterized repeat protein (TIGR03803 family)
MKKIYVLSFVILCLAVGTTKAQSRDLFDFSTAVGKYPYGSLTLSGNVLYGMTNYGGVYNDGVVFSIHTDSS